jgi:hypothetical protein
MVSATDPGEKSALSPELLRGQRGRKGEEVKSKPGDQGRKR